ncbi:hypothetical protein J7F03_20710 [Streptomyces sp. ISL-43]|uniref:hypothetical protein n=1 Tax=Streptomyces sp. ISL-43 TaxID=2819183 RepID=UPI001BE58AEC|nr:hypothetical protein [Streptomyces sp. ISL-43]MBT2449465.1 hypothetical protein [Streptomyces sp. ISL-43]
MTYPSQAEEALRQVTRDERVRAGLTYAVQRLTDRRSHHVMTDVARLAIAQRYATDTLGWTDVADELIRDLLTVMPEITRDITRGEYAVIIQPTAGAHR